MINLMLPKIYIIIFLLYYCLLERLDVVRDIYDFDALEVRKKIRIITLILSCNVYRFFYDKCINMGDYTLDMIYSMNHDIDYKVI